ncbi:MAG: hypothetical protein NUV61_04020 [Candidatus Azambacteria bacterium]|nr:hypothetical protein [Candidatus Azambacteria bacterium]
MSFILTTMFIFLTVVCGRKYVKSGKTREDRDDNFLASHRVCAAISLIGVLVVVVLVEILKQGGGVEESIRSSIVHSLHLVVASLFALSFLSALFLFTGKRTPKIHRFLVYPSCVFFVTTLIFGGIMLLGIAV